MEFLRWVEGEDTTIAGHRMVVGWSEDNDTRPKRLTMLRILDWQGHERARTWASMPGPVGLRCCTTATAAPKSGGNVETIFLSAGMTPAKAPITTTLNNPFMLVSPCMIGSELTVDPNFPDEWMQRLGGVVAAPRFRLHAIYKPEPFISKTRRLLLLVRMGRFRVLLTRILGDGETSSVPIECSVNCLTIFTES